MWSGLAAHNFSARSSSWKTSALWLLIPDGQGADFICETDNVHCVFFRGSSFGFTYVKPHGPVVFIWTTVSSSVEK
jgi:hypothetical protein